MTCTPPGEYETHVTVRCDTDRTVERLRAWAGAAGLKVTHIVLARGRMVSQPMLTLTGTDGPAGQRTAADALVARLAAAGFEPVRVKIEAAPWSPEAPRSDAAAEGLGRDRYFEHHLKLRLAADFDRAALTVLAAVHGAHLSWNARRASEGGRHERFVTQRCHGVGADRAGRALEALLADVRAGGYEIDSVEREFVLYDSDLSVDDGWIEEREEAGAGT
ncbi:hypothetical protein [Streptomyces sp. NPDC051219]|uniref:hypothetical protein n=1 Tax=Streptomyces sp. NPDC051219 TaxID=3155283 RepID=UPI00343A349B